MSDDRVFKALADSSRRRLLDELTGHPAATLGELSAVLPTMSRFGVMKHLGVLEDAGLVVTRREGRTKLHYLNAVPIRRIHDRWISKFASPWVEAITQLTADLETDPKAEVPIKEETQRWPEPSSSVRPTSVPAPRTSGRH